MSNSKSIAMNVVIVILLIQIRAVVLHSNHHGHSHDVETPHFKYSREANEKQSVHDNHAHSHQHHHHHHESLDDHYHAHDQYHFDKKEHHHAHFSGENDNHHHHQHHIKSHEGTKANYKPYDPNGILSFLNDFRTRTWAYSIGSTLLISFMPFVILSVIPLQANTAENEPMLKILLSFGSGGLLGDAFLHLIPHSIPSHQDSHKHSHSHSHTLSGSGHSHGPHDMMVGCYVLAGILAFLTIEKLVRILRSERIIHSHSHSYSSSSSNGKNKMKKREKNKEKKSDVSSAEESLHGCSDEEHLIETTDHETGFRVAAYLNMAADFAHNFTDGLAIGASFLASTAVGVVTMITVLFHEIPHEIGDFAILVQSGFTKKKAMSVQLLTALGALTGCVLSLCSADADKLSDSATSSWILPFTAGGFIYIATVTVIPELLENSSIWQTIKEIIALLTGIILIFKLPELGMDAFLNLPKKQNNASTTLMEIPWVEKYRPRKVEEIAFQNEVVSVLKKVLDGADLPNLLFYGPPGTGKTSAAIALCRQLFRNNETYYDRVMEMNASDERGINIVRNKIKEFARRAVSSQLPDGSPVVGLKVIILDEADAMTTPAQAALRRTMERESRTTRFFLICNYITRIIDPLTSRCAKFRFKSISSECQIKRLEWICQNENIEFDPLAIKELIELCDGDMRKSVSALQTISSCHKKLFPTDVRQFLGALPDDVVEQFLAACKSLNHDQLYICVESIRREGYGVYQLMKQFFNVCEMRILDGANEFLQLLDFGTVVMEQFKVQFKMFSGLSSAIS